MPFDTKLRVRKVSAWDWELTGPLVYRGRTQTFVVPTGFSTDFASVPQILWSLVSPINLSAEPSVVHDYLYDKKPVTRAEADGLFRRMLREAGVGFLRRWIMYLAVRCFGGFAWEGK